MIKRLFIPITVATTLLLACCIYFLFHGRLNQNTTPLHNSESPSIFIQRMSLNSHDQQGNLSATIKAEQATYYKPKDLIQFTHPDITSYSDLTHQPSWHITAEKGQRHKNNTIITLSGNVQFYRIATSDSPAMTIQTTHATIKPQLSTASTDQPVSIQQQYSTIQGSGLTANLKTGDYTLQSQTQGEYIPEPSP